MARRQAHFFDNRTLHAINTPKFSVISIAPTFPAAKDGSLIVDSAYFDTCDRSQPINGLGSGDSSLLLDFTKSIDETSKTLFEQVRDEVIWEEMFHKGNPVPRLVCMQGTFIQSDVTGEIVCEPVYRHPADAQPPMNSWTPTVDILRQLTSDAIQQPLNHALIQWYRCGDDYISEHADKTLDIERGSAIVNLSLGATRTMVLRDKKGHREDRQPVVAGTKPSRRTQRVSMQNGCLFSLGWDTNRKMTHEIRQDKRVVKSEEELAFGGHRISLTFRHVSTFMRLRDHRIFGQGAPHKTESELDRRIKQGGQAEAKEDEEETEKLIEAFGAENRQEDFDWDAYYGQGFSVLNMAVTDSSSQVGRQELIRAASQVPPCQLQPECFFLAWNGVLTLVYGGFPPSLVSIKQQLNNISGLQNENFGSMWPKTTLAATNDDAAPLTLPELEKLRDICQHYSVRLKQSSTAVTVNEVSMVKFDERSLECPTSTTTVTLKGGDMNASQDTSSEEQARVRQVVGDWEGEKLSSYLEKANAAGSRASTYGSSSPSGTTVVAFLSKSQNCSEDQLSETLKLFQNEIDEAFPNRFSWMKHNSLHCTLRSLDM